MRSAKGIIFLTVTLLVTFALHIHAGEQMGDPATVKGLVVSSGHELTINDGVRDYLLLGVDNPKIEGTICEVIGRITFVDTVPVIEVKTIKVIADKYPDDDSIGSRRGFGSPYSGRHRSDIQGSAMVSPGVSMPDLCTPSLPIWDGAVWE